MVGVVNTVPEVGGGGLHDHASLRRLYRVAHFSLSKPVHRGLRIQGIVPSNTFRCFFRLFFVSTSGNKFVYDFFGLFLIPTPS